jgi:hypothetical protein
VVASANAIAGTELAVGEAAIDDYAMLSRIDFSHPIFAPMSEAPYNDFSKIRFWSHRSLAKLSDQWSILARFDDGAPAFIEKNALNENGPGSGKLWILSAGWQPNASQLALSTKFIPLIFRLVDSGSQQERTDNLSVGDSIPFAFSETAAIVTPSGESFGYRGPDDTSVIDSPGVYRWTDGDQSVRFAVNLEMTESRVEPIDDDVLEQFGVQLQASQSPDALAERQRQLRDHELEGRQRIWQWLLAAVLGLLGLETWMGKRAEKKSHEPSPA